MKIRIVLKHPPPSFFAPHPAAIPRSNLLIVLLPVNVVGMTAHDFPLLLYDAHCSVCRRFVQWFVHADSAGRLRIAPLQGSYGDAVRRDHAAFSERDSAIWIPEHGTPVQRSTAVLGVMQYLGGLWGIAAALGRLVPLPIRDWIYRTFAGNRRYFGWMGLDEFDEKVQARIIK